MGLRHSFARKKKGLIKCENRTKAVENVIICMYIRKFSMIFMFRIGLRRLRLSAQPINYSLSRFFIRIRGYLLGRGTGASSEAMMIRTVHDGIFLFIVFWLVSLLAYVYG